MCCLLSQHFSKIFLILGIICFILLHLNISVCATFYNSSEEIRNIFSSHQTKSVLKGPVTTGNFAEGGLIDTSFTQYESNSSIKNANKSLSNGQDTAFAFTGLLNKKNVSLSFTNETRNKSHDSHQTSTIKTLLPTKLIETGSNLFLGVPEVIHFNGTSSIKPRKGVHYSKIVPRKGVGNENEAFHVSLENQSCFWLSERECYSNRDVECNCCKEDNVLGKNVKQTPVQCKNCKIFNKLSSEGSQTCKNICCFPVSSNFVSMTSTENIYNNNLNYQTVSSTEKELDSSFPPKISEKISNNSSSVIDKKESNNLITFKKDSKFKPLITKVPYDAENMTDMLGKAQEKVVIPLAVSLFLLPLMGILIFFLWQRTKEYWNKRYYKRMDFLIDGIYND